MSLDKIVYEHAFEKAAIGLGIVDLKRNFLKVNSFFCNLVGYTERELLQMNVVDITHPDDMPKNVQLDDEVIDDKISYFEMEKRYIHKSGRVFWVLLTVTLERDSSGDPLYFIAQVQDISARKALEVEKRLEAMLHLIGTYNHEINNPLAILSGSFSRMKKHGLTEDLVKKSETSINRISEVLKKIQTVVKSGKFEIEDQAGKIIKIPKN